MAHISTVTGKVVMGPKGKPFGEVTNVLFHPSEPRVIGLEIAPPAMLYVVARKPRYLPLDQFVWGSDQLGLAGDKPLEGSSAEKAMGYSWEETIIWLYMPVKTVSGAELGLVRDVKFSFKTGIVDSLLLTDGLTADIAAGRQTLANEHVEGFDGTVVRVADAASAAMSSGGMAARAGEGAAVAKVTAQETAKLAVKGAVVAARAAKKSKVGKRASKGWKSFKEAYREGLKSDEE